MSTKGDSIKQVGMVVGFKMVSVLEYLYLQNLRVSYADRFGLIYVLVESCKIGVL